MKYYISTFGCQANERDSETIAGLLGEIGYENARAIEDADVIIFNTCCIREKAEHKVFSQIGSLKGLKSKNPDLIIGICGCIVQQEDMPQKIRRRLPHVDLIFGTHNIHDLPGLLAGIRAQKTTQCRVLPAGEGIVEGLPSRRQFPYRALVSITFGCNNFCTYCIVPYVRGREKSRQPADIISEIKGLASAGTKEVMLLGQNVNSYGRDLNPPVSFASLLREVNGVEGLKRIRYMTSHPRDFSQDLVEAIAESGKVCRHFHLPVQSGSNRILKLMNRGYTREYYLDLLDRIKAVFPASAITTDFIVGFPQETAQDFDDTLDLVARAHFDSAFTFSYSPRTGTPAARMQEQIPAGVKKARLQELMNLQNKISLEKNMLLKGRVLEVLVEGRSKTSQRMMTGRTAENKFVLFEGEEELTGTFVNVEITTPQTWVLKGKLIERE